MLEKKGKRAEKDIKNSLYKVGCVHSHMNQIIHVSHVVSSQHSMVFLLGTMGIYVFVGQEELLNLVKDTSSVCRWPHGMTEVIELFLFFS